jgi:hypothetical protein
VENRSLKLSEHFCSIQKSPQAKYWDVFFKAYNHRLGNERRKYSNTMAAEAGKQEDKW